MNRTGIEWCDYTWNPVTGCRHDCRDSETGKPYCYAQPIALRFGKERVLGMLATPMQAALPGETFPYGFDPTFYSHRLPEPSRVRVPGRVFVCSMADLFGKWVPAGVIRSVFEAMVQADWHTYIVLTKNPGRALELLPGLREAGLIPERLIVGTSITGAWDDAEQARCMDLAGIRALRSASASGNGAHSASGLCKTVLSLEPWTAFNEAASEFLWTAGQPDWLIVGGRSRAGELPAFTPPRYWFEALLPSAAMAGIPVFVKDNAGYPGTPRQFLEW